MRRFLILIMAMIPSLTAASAQEEGIGVFAFYHAPKSNGRAGVYNSHSGLPDFMYNQKLVYNEGTWSYSPLKYWSGAENSRLSFFAYAPWDENMAWEDLKISTNLSGNMVRRDFYIENDVPSQQDQMWAEPSLNLKHSDAKGGIRLKLRHLCARIGLSFSCEDQVLSVDTLSLKGVHKQFSYCFRLNNGNWESSCESLTGNQDIILFGEELEKVKEGGYLFLSPQNLKENDITLQLCYTLDGKRSRRTVALKDIVSEGKLQCGKAYCLKLKF